VVRDAGRWPVSGTRSPKVGWARRNMEFTQFSKGGGPTGAFPETRLSNRARRDTGMCAGALSVPFRRDVLGPRSGVRGAPPIPLVLVGGDRHAKSRGGWRTEQTGGGVRRGQNRSLLAGRFRSNGMWLYVWRAGAGPKNFQKKKFPSTPLDCAQAAAVHRLPRRGTIAKKGGTPMKKNSVLHEWGHSVGNSDYKMRSTWKLESRGHGARAN